MSGPFEALQDQVIPTATREACAPYNFVPLPERVITPVRKPDDLPNHDTYANAQYPHTGYFEVSLTTQSPLYIRCGLNLTDYDLQQRRGDNDLPFDEQVKNRHDFFYTADPSRPVIPGSSLRGMLRAVLEIASYGKVQPVTSKNLFYRSMGNDAMGQIYRNRFVAVRGGFLRKRLGQWEIDECTVGRIRRDLLPNVPAGVSATHPAVRSALYEGQAPNLQPRWDTYQNRELHVNIEESPAPRARHPHVHEAAFTQAALPTAQPGCTYKVATLVLTGDMEAKKREFVFLHDTPIFPSIAVPRDVIDQFQDDDQITLWQQNAFPINKPVGSCRLFPGHLREGEPVFFLLGDQNTLAFLGRAQHFRYPYTYSPHDLVPPSLRRSEDVDYAEALFGYVRDSATTAVQGSKARAYAGRVSVTQASWNGASPPGRNNPWLPGAPLTPRILSSPKPTAFQHYLVQTSAEARELKHYQKDEALIRGHKRYWPQGSRTAHDLEPRQDRYDVLPTEAPKQFTRMKPVDAGTTFNFRVYFENLSDRELGALCWTIQPVGPEGREYCHSLGMGKALGMGVVKLTASLHLTERQQRYERLFTEDGAWETGCGAVIDLAHRPSLLERVAPFEQHILRQLGQPTAFNLWEMRRIAVLLRMMECNGVPPTFPASALNRHDNTRAMVLRPTANLNEFRERPVLPDPGTFTHARLQQLSGALRPNPDQVVNDPPLQPPITPAGQLPTPTDGQSPLYPNVDELSEQINALTTAQDVKTRLQPYVQKWAKLPDSSEKTAMADSIAEVLRRTATEGWARQQKWWRHLPYSRN